MKYAPRLPEQRSDIQALLASGFGWLKRSQFWLLTIKEGQAERARIWIADLLKTPLIHAVQEVADLKAKKEPKKPPEMAALAFSHAGLCMLGQTESPEFPFPTAFRSGMGSELRRKLLRDDSRDHWVWTDVGRPAEKTEAEPGTQRRPCVIHILLGLWWTEGAAVPRVDFDADVFERRVVEGCPSFFRDKTLYEPFEFRDGVSQPTVYGLKDEIAAGPFVPSSKGKQDPAASPDQVIGAGEFILGYRNEYDELSYCPDVEGWKKAPPRPDAPERHPGSHFGLNGSYLAVRQIEQNLDAFATVEGLPVTGCPVGADLVESMLGRRRDGTPLELPARRTPLPDMEANDFRYRVKDQSGFTTARGSHIRRANPRDMLAHDVSSGIASSKLHRLLRRGRPYRDRVEGKPTEGLFFIACNTDLERQFEFVHQRWLRNPRFADLEDEDDPFVGAVATNKKFSMPGLPSGNRVRFDSFTSTIGGGYFFLPGLNALHFIARCAQEGAPSDLSAAGSVRTKA